MKIFFLTLMLTLVACQKQEVATNKVAPAAATGTAAEEDCDDKAKKTVEIKEETISLTNGDAGCTLEDPTSQNQF